MKAGFLFSLLFLAMLSMPRQAPAQEPWGAIVAQPNPCRIHHGEEMCVAHITWQTRNVARVKVFVKAEGHDKWEEKEFGHSLVCESERCRAPWIRPETRYVFKLIDFSHGDRGRELASVEVTGEREP